MDQTDHRPHDSPFDEMRDRLHQHEAQAEVQIHVVMDHERAYDEHSDQRTEARPLSETGAPR